MEGGEKEEGCEKKIDSLKSITRSFTRNMIIISVMLMIEAVMLMIKMVGGPSSEIIFYVLTSIIGGVILATILTLWSTSS